MKSLKQVLSENKRLFVAAAAAFLVGVPAGMLAYPLVEDQLPALLEEAFGDVMDGSTLDVVVKVFLRNTSASLIMLFLGMTVLLAVASLFLNGFVVGLVFMLSLSKGLGLSTIFLGVAPHGIFELPAIFLSVAAGIRVGLAVFQSKGRRVAAASQAIREAAAVYLTVVLPLLAVAAAVEVLVSLALVK